jgi:signal transduction histidine kinase
MEQKNRLKESREELQAVFDGIGDGISVIDRGFNIRRVNRGVLEVFNKSGFSDIMGRKCYAEYFGEEKVCDGCPALSAIEKGKANHLTRVLRKGDKDTVFDIYAFPLTGRDGTVGGVIEHIRDMSDRLNLEGQVLRYERLAGAGELAMGLAHEIRNPLSNISASAQLCLGKYGVNEQLKRYLKVILRNSGNANRIVKDLLDFARPSEIVLKPGQVEKVIKRACSLVRGRVSRDRVRLVKRVSRRLPKVMLDEKRLEGAFLNFILNALDALSRGGSLIVATYLDTLAREVVVTFTDTGVGIPEENVSRVFDPFFTTKKSGTGLGLSICHHIIARHNGSIRIKSEAGKGTEVTVRLPVYGKD